MLAGSHPLSALHGTLRPQDLLREEDWIGKEPTDKTDLPGLESLGTPAIPALDSALLNNFNREKEKTSVSFQCHLEPAEP